MIHLAPQIMKRLTLFILANLVFLFTQAQSATIRGLITGPDKQEGLGGAM